MAELAVINFKWAMVSLIDCFFKGAILLCGIIPPLLDAEYSMEMPGIRDWGDNLLDLDIAAAYRNFSGKDLEAATKLFVKNALNHQEDLVFMPLACFRYYVHAYIEYLLSPDCEGDSDGASCFFGLVESRMRDIQKSDPYLIERVKKVLGRLKDNQKWYDAPEHIYGNFQSKAESLLKKLTA